MAKVSGDPWDKVQQVVPRTDPHAYVPDGLVATEFNTLNPPCQDCGEPKEAEIHA